MSSRLTNRILTSSLKQASKQILRQSAVRSIASPIVAVQRPARFFSSSVRVFNEFTSEVATSLENELIHEKENKEDFSKELDQFLASSGFEIAGAKGSVLERLVKKTDDEVINVFFDINQVSELNPAEPEQDLNEDEPAEIQEDADDSFFNLNVVIEKKSDGSAIAFDVLVGAEDGQTFINSLTSYENSADVLNETAEAEHKRDLSYNGPSFSNLDEALQVNLENYLVSRGVDEQLYQFILGYGLYKENTEYVRWLNNLNSFFKK